MTSYTLTAFANTALGWMGSTIFSGTGTVAAAATSIVVIDDDAMLDDEQATFGETLDLSSQVLGNSFGVVNAGQIIQSVYSWSVTNVTSGLTGTGYLLRISTATSGAPGAALQDGGYYQVFTIPVHVGDTLNYLNQSAIGQVAYAALSPMQPIEFTPGNDGGADKPIDLNLVFNGSIAFSGSPYSAQGGDDFVILPNIASIQPGSSWDFQRNFSGAEGNDVIQGGDAGDSIGGGSGNDWLFGLAGNDDLDGGSGDDILAGGDGSDILHGGEGRDLFIFTRTDLGTSRTGEHDVIGDFKQGEDKIDVSALYAGLSFGGIRGGSASGAASLSGYKMIFFTDGGKTWVMGDTNNVPGADFTIELTGSYKLKGTDVVSSLIATVNDWASVTGGLDYTRFHQDHFFGL